MSDQPLPLLDLALLQTLVAVDQTGTLAKAADKVGRTQSAVSLQMQRLEQALALELFDRRGRALALTDAGEAMLGYARRMLELNREAITAVRGHRVAGQVRLGMSVDFEQRMVVIERDVHRLAGREFNVGSAKQLGESRIRFDSHDAGAQGCEYH